MINSLGILQSQVILVQELPWPFHVTEAGLSKKAESSTSEANCIASLEDQFKLLLEHFKLEDKEEEEEQFHNAFDEPQPEKKETPKKTREKEHAEQEQHARARVLDWKLARN